MLAQRQHAVVDVARLSWITIFKRCRKSGSRVILYSVPNAPSARPSTMICMPRNFMSHWLSVMSASMITNRLSLIW